MLKPTAVLALGAALVVGAASLAAAAEWGGIVPGESTTESVRARHGAPTRTTTQKVQSYDAVQWTYEGPQAPAGIQRMVVDFGLLTPRGYRRDLVRDFKLEPKPGVFPRNIVLNGWGPPTRVGREGDAEVFFYQEGLVVYFDAQGRTARLMLFLPPQPAAPASAQPRR